MARRQKICVMCKKVFDAVSYRQKYCSRECGQNYRTLEKRIFNVFESKEVNEQIARLEELGEKYTFPAPHEQLNNFYKLEGIKNDVP